MLQKDGGKFPVFHPAPALVCTHLVSVTQCQCVISRVLQFWHCTIFGGGTSSTLSVKVPNYWSWHFENLLRHNQQILTNGWFKGSLLTKMPVHKVLAKKCLLLLILIIRQRVSLSKVETPPTKCRVWWCVVHFQGPPLRRCGASLVSWLCTTDQDSTGDKLFVSTSR